MLRAIGIGLLAVLAGFGAWYEFHIAARIGGIPVRSAGMILDSPYGTLVTAYGRIAVGDPGNLVVFTTSIERCTSRFHSGTKRYERSCSWETTSRHTPPFALLLPGQQSLPVPVVNEDYSLEAPLHTNMHGSTRYEGFEYGELVLVIGTTSSQGIRAQTVYGGTREDYIRTLSYMAWGLVALASGLFIASILYTLRS